MVYTPKGRIKYGSYSDKSSYWDGFKQQEDPIVAAAKRLKQTLPEEYKYTIPELMTKLNPDYVDPKHLAPLMNAFDRVQKGERVRFLFSVPPQHAKSTAVGHGIIRYLLTHRNKNVMYICYNQDFAEEKSRDIRKWAEQAGLEFVKDSNSIATWRLSNGCIFRATGLIGGNVTGNRVDLLVVDDPHKERKDVESATIRQQVYDSFSSAALSRMPQSVIVIHTRWLHDDLIGRLSKLPGWEYVNLPVYNDDGTVIWPEVRPAEVIEEAKAGMSPYDFSALFMGHPVPRGNALFNEPQYYDKVPGNIVVGVGYDLAYTAKTHADYSVVVVMATDGQKFYILDVVRKQTDATTFSKELKRLREQYPKSVFMSYISGPEKGSVSLLNSIGLNLSFLPATTDKFDRAQSVSAAWNSGKVLLPKSAPWLNTFISEVSHFTGVGDPSDDQVDALAGAFASLARSPIRRGLSNLYPL